MLCKAMPPHLEIPTADKEVNFLALNFFKMLQRGINFVKLPMAAPLDGDLGVI